MPSAFVNKTFSKEMSTSFIIGLGSLLNVLSICLFDIFCFLLLQIHPCAPIVSSPNDVVWLALRNFFQISKLFERGDGSSKIILIGGDGRGRNVSEDGG